MLRLNYGAFGASWNDVLAKTGEAAKDQAASDISKAWKQAAGTVNKQGALAQTLQGAAEKLNAQTIKEVKNLAGDIAQKQGQQLVHQGVEDIWGRAKPWLIGGSIFVVVVAGVLIWRSGKKGRK